MKNFARAAAVLGLSALLLSSCVNRKFNSNVKSLRVEEEESAPSDELDFKTYLNECSKALEVPLASMPEIDCTSGGIVQTKVNGKIIDPSNYRSGMQCDNPSFIANQRMSCVPNSWAGTLDVPGTPAQFVFLCRQFKTRPAGTAEADVVGVIARNKNTGATCFFESKEGGKGIDLKKTALLQDDLGVKFWKTPKEVVNNAGSDCVSCHNGQPWLRSNFILSTSSGKNATIPENFDETTHKAIPYWVVGDDKLEKLNNRISWTPQKLVATGDEKTCTGCHRIGAGAFCTTYSPISVGETPSVAALSAALIQKPFPENNLHWNLYTTKLKKYASDAEWKSSPFFGGLKALQKCCGVSSTECNWQNLTSDQQ